MTIIPDYRRCKICGRRYSWNPDVGQFHCPYCLGLKVSRPLVVRLLNALAKKKGGKNYN